MSDDLSAKKAEEPKQNDLGDPEISRLREAVLSWIEKAKTTSQTIDD